MGHFCPMRWGILCPEYRLVLVFQFLSASLYVSKRVAYIEIGCVVTSLVVGWLVVGCHARALWPNGAS